MSSETKKSSKSTKKVAVKSTPKPKLTAGQKLLGLVADNAGSYILKNDHHSSSFVMSADGKKKLGRFQANALTSIAKLIVAGKRAKDDKFTTYSLKK